MVPCTHTMLIGTTSSYLILNRHINAAFGGGIFFSFGCCNENPVIEIVFAKLQVGNTTKQATKHLNV